MPGAHRGIETTTELLKVPARNEPGRDFKL
jgi:hypothetical protein